MNKVYKSVLKTLQEEVDQRALELNGDKFISIEFIQDLIEKEL